MRAIDLARFQLELAEQQILINQRGLEDLSLRDDADPQAILDREDALLDAENARDQSLTDLRNAILEYLLITGQIRVRPDGTFDAPDGMMMPEATGSDIPAADYPQTPADPDVDLDDVEESDASAVDPDTDEPGPD